jgi:tetratricopeptide (TPR) repeat protein
LQGSISARKLILERAQQYLDSLAAEAHNDPDLLRELAQAYGRLGSVLGDARDANLGNSAKAIENDKKSVDLLKAAAALRPRDPQVQRDLAEAYLNFGVVVHNPNEMNTALSKAKGILEPLAANPQDLQAQAGLAKFQELEAGMLLNDKDSNLALEAYQKSLVLYDRLAKANPGNARYQLEDGQEQRWVSWLEAQDGR